MNRIKNYTFCLLFFLSFLTGSTVYAQFAPASLVDSSTNQITNILSVDLNQDSLNDLLVTRKFTANSLISFYLNQGGLSFGPETVIATGSSQVTNIAVADFDNNNWPDVVSIGDANNAVTVYLNNSMNFTAQPLDTFTFFESDIAVLDVDNDSDLDFVAIGGTTFKVFNNNGSANFNKQVVTTPLSDFFDITTGDIDADGFDDVITGGSNISFYKNNNGSLQFDSARTAQIPSSFNLFVRLVDLDQDGDLDLFSEGNNSSGARWLENDGNGNFSNSHLIDASVNNIRSAALDDFDQDGDLDLILIKNFDLYLYTNIGQGSFSTPLLIQDTTTTISCVSATDLNKDNQIDLIWSADLSVQENNLALFVKPKTIFDELFKVYPNPTNERLFIEIPEAGTLRVSNAMGQLVDQRSLIKGKNLLKLNLKPQLYFFTMDFASKSLVKKVIIK